jgi:hypothetical protein
MGPTRITSERQRRLNAIDNSLDDVWFGQPTYNSAVLHGYQIQRINDDIVIRDIAGGLDAFTGSRDSARLFLIDRITNDPSPAA